MFTLVHQQKLCVNKMKIVIIAKTIHPYLSPRSHRATELAKELARQGHRVTLYAILGTFDYSQFMSDTGIVVKNLGRAYMGILDSDGNRRRTFLSKAFTILFHWSLDFPDIFLMWLTKKVILKEAPFDYLISIAFPHTIHWGVALSIRGGKRNFNKWAADCGDPYMLNPHQKFNFYFKYVEKWWSKKADYITIPVEEAIEGYYLEFHHKIKVIPQGFDFVNIQLSEYKESAILQFAYSGMIYPGTRDPTLFMEYLCTMKHINFKFIVYTTSKSFFETYKIELADKLEIRDYIPRNELLKELSKMDFLINIKNNSGVQLPSKLIDYYITKRPVLEITSSFNEVDAINEFLNRDYSSKKTAFNISQYDISNVASKFIDLYSK
jgi:hypothetical protein